MGRALAEATAYCVRLCEVKCLSKDAHILVPSCVVVEKSTVKFGIKDSWSELLDYAEIS